MLGLGEGGEEYSGSRLVEVVVEIQGRGQKSWLGAVLEARSCLQEVRS